MKCATCKHWEPVSHYTKISWRVGRCQKTEMTDDYDPPPKGGAMAVDGSGYFAILLTADEFGCLRWEALR